MTSNLYGTDGKCHNAEAGTYNHECGKPATWIAEKAHGWRSGFCDDCKEHGRERHGFARWWRIDGFQEGTYYALPAGMSWELMAESRRLWGHAPRMTCLVAVNGVAAWGTLSPRDYAVAS